VKDEPILVRHQGDNSGGWLDKRPANRAESCKFAVMTGPKAGRVRRHEMASPFRRNEPFGHFSGKTIVRQFFKVLVNAAK
jgi:hypothetical protein